MARNDLTDQELRILRWFASQGHNDCVWAQLNKDRLRDMNPNLDSFNPVGNANDIVRLETIDQEFEDSLAWLANGRRPWAEWWF